MQEPGHYSKAPITEAIIDLRTIIPETFPVERFAEIHASIQQDFPIILPYYKGRGAFHYEPGLSFKVETSEHQSGFWFKSENSLQTLQATLEGFTFNRLAPYTSWEEFSATAKHLWTLYQELCQPLSVTRAAIRYINQIHIPAKGLVELEDYLCTLPEISAQLPQGALQSFFMQLQIPQPDLEATLIINETIAPPTNPELVTIILDLDLFREHAWESHDKNIWQFLEKLRLRKNEVFEASITDKVRGLIN
jgi:uncharacterized protein (TIGR04255 family)